MHLAHRFSEVDLKNWIGVKSADALWKQSLKAIPELHGFSKGEAWGATLMRYVSTNPEFTSDDSNVAKERPLITALNTALRALSVSYNVSRKEWMIDPPTLSMVERSPSNGDV